MPDKRLLVQFTALVFPLLIQVSHQATCPQSPTTSCDCANDNGKLQINCRDKQLTAIPTFTQTGLTYDEITFASSQATGCPSCNKISAVPENAFANLNVKKIILTQNAISSYSANAFAGLETILQHLELEGDGTNALPNDAINPLTNLQVLHLEHFAQQSMKQSNAPSSLPQLTQLTFKNIKQLTTFDFNAFLNSTGQPKFPLLSSFFLKEIPTITSLPVQALQELKELTELQISGTGISRIFGSSFSMYDKLINLHITYNSYLQTIDNGAFDGIYDTLEFLFLGHNQLRELNSLNTSSWQQLTQLNLQYNPLGTIQASAFSTLGQKLAYLNLDSCQLTNIQSSVFTGLAGLHTLVLSNNRLQSVPDFVFQNMPGLTELRLNKQQTSMTLNTNSFGGIENSLNHLFIGHNTINVPMFWALIEKLPNLLELSAPEVNLGTVPDKAFKNNDKVTILELENNGISALQDGSFYRLRDSLETLTLSFNSISTISKCVFNNFTVMRHLYLLDNPLHCDCSLRWLYDWVHAQSDVLLTSSLLGRCRTPVALKDKYFHEISRTDLTCGAGYQEPVCTDLYAITTTTTTTTTTAPRNIVNIVFGTITHNSVQVTWSISNKDSSLTGLILETRNSSQANKTLHKDTVTETVSNLEPGTRYTFCLYLQINEVVDNQYTQCKPAETVPLNIPTINLHFGVITETTVDLVWEVSDRTDVSGYVLNINKGNQVYRDNILIHKDLKQQTIENLAPDTYYTFCLHFKLNGVPYPQYEDCETQKTVKPEITTVPPTTPVPESNIGIIVGAAVGAVVFVAIIILIIVILVCYKKPPQKPPPAAAPISFIPAPSGSLPQAGGTARRFAKPKDGKEGAVGVDDIKIQTISNGGFEGQDSRFSAGSYQLLHEKDFHRPGSSASTGSGGATGHYVNDLSVERPLPRTPYGNPNSKMGKSRGYVNTGFTGSADPLPQTANTYYEIDPSKVDKHGKSEKVTAI